MQEDLQRRVQSFGIDFGDVQNMPAEPLDGVVLGLEGAAGLPS